MFRVCSRASLHWGIRRHHGALLTGIFLAFFGLGSHAESALTLDQAVRAAQGRSLQLVAQDAAALAARERAVAAGQRPDPVFKAALTNVPIDGPDRFSLTRDFMTMRSVGVMQELTREDKRTARSARFERAAEAAEAGRTLAVAALQRDTAKAWLDRHYLERALEVLQSQRQEATLQIEAADAVYRGGRGSQTDAFAARSAVALIDDEIRKTEQQIATATTRLVRWVGEAGQAPLGAPPAFSEPPINAGTLEAQLPQHPRIALLARQEEVARADAEVAQREKRSDWSVELMYSQRGPAYSNMVSVNLSIPLQIDPKQRQDRELAARLALVEQVRAEREEAMRELTAETLGWLQEWQGNRDRLAHYDDSLIPLAAERTRAALAAYRGGSGPLSAVLDARRMEIFTRLERLRLEMATADLWARLEYLIPAEERVSAPDRSISFSGR